MASRAQIELEECLGSFEFASKIILTPSEGGATAEIVVHNPTNFSIWGLVVKSLDPIAVDLEMDGEGIINFGELKPGETTHYSEFVPKLDGLFDEETAASVQVIDLVDESGSELIRSIFWTRWPYVSSMADLEAARRLVCAY